MIVNFKIFESDELTLSPTGIDAAGISVDGGSWIPGSSNNKRLKYKIKPDDSKIISPKKKKNVQKFTDFVKDTELVNNSPMILFNVYHNY